MAFMAPGPHKPAWSTAYVPLLNLHVPSWFSLWSWALPCSKLGASLEALALLAPHVPVTQAFSGSLNTPGLYLHCTSLSPILPETLPSSLSSADSSVFFRSQLKLISLDKPFLTSDIRKFLLPALVTANPSLYLISYT